MRTAHFTERSTDTPLNTTNGLHKKGRMITEKVKKSVVLAGKTFDIRVEDQKGVRIVSVFCENSEKFFAQAHIIDGTAVLYYDDRKFGRIRVESGSLNETAITQAILPLVRKHDDFVDV